MAEVVGFVASIVAFGELAKSLIKLLRKYHDEQKGNDRTTRNIAARLELVLATLDDIQMKEKNGQLTARMQQALENALCGLHRQALELDQFIQKIHPTSDIPLWRRVKVALEAPRVSKELMGMQQAISGFESTLSFYAQFANPSPSSLRLGSSSQQRYFEIPILPVKKFVGRKSLLAKIKSILVGTVEKQDEMNICVLLGLGGQGKSQLALKHCQEMRLERSVFWIDAESIPVAVQSFNKMLSLIMDSIICLNTCEEVRNFMTRILPSLEHDILFVFDNLDHPSDFHDTLKMLPPNFSGHVLITSRHREAHRVGTVLEIGPMDEEEGSELLLLQALIERTDEHIKQAKNIVQLLYGLPLAIDQAASYINSRNLPLGDFPDYFQRRKRHCLEHIPDSLSYRRSTLTSAESTQLCVFTTWEMSLHECGISEEARGALLHLLTVASFWSGPVSSSMFEAFYNQSRESAPSWLRWFTTESKWNSDAFQDALVRAFGTSLVQSLDTFMTCTKFSFHPLVRDWLKLRLSQSKRQTYLVESILILKAYAEMICDDLSPTNLADLNEAVAHIDACSQLFTSRNATDAEEANTVQIWLSSIETFAKLYWLADELPKAEKIIRKGIEETRHEDQMLRFKRELGICCLRKCEFRLSKAYLSEVAEAEARWPSPPNQDHLKTMHFLGAVLAELREFGRAKSILSEVKQKRDQLLGPEALETLQTTHWLAISYYGLKQYDLARELFQQVLKAYETQRRMDRLPALSAMFSFGNLYHDIQEYADAEVLYRKSLNGYEQAVGNSHSMSLTVANNLGMLYTAQANFELAHVFLTRSLSGRKLVLGRNHVRTLQSQMLLGILTFEQKDWDGAVELLHDALKRAKEYVGSYQMVTMRSAIHLIRAQSLLDRKADASEILNSFPEWYSVPVETVQDYALRQQLQNLLEEAGKNESDTERESLALNLNNNRAMLQRFRESSAVTPLGDSTMGSSDLSPIPTGALVIRT